MDDSSAMPIPDTAMKVNSVEQHEELLQRLVASRVTSSCVDDVLQEVALAVEKSSNIPDDPAEFRNWICSIAVRQCALVLRQNERRQRVTEAARDRIAIGEADALDDPTYWLLAQETKEQLQEAIGRMEATPRQMLLMKFIIGATYRDIAEEFDLPVHTAERRVQAAKRQLRQMMLSVGFCEEDYCD